MWFHIHGQTMVAVNIVSCHHQAKSKEICYQKRTKKFFRLSFAICNRNQQLKSPFHLPGCPFYKIIITFHGILLTKCISNRLYTVPGQRSNSKTSYFVRLFLNMCSPCHQLCLQQFNLITHLNLNIWLLNIFVAQLLQNFHFLFASFMLTCQQWKQWKDRSFVVGFGYYPKLGK